MAHAVTTHLAQRDFYAALLANHTAVFKPLILATQTLLIFYWPEYFGAE